MRMRFIGVAASLLLGGALGAQTTASPVDTVSSPLDTLYQTYDEGVISLPFTVGLRIPSYDRVNGLSLPWGPHVAVPGGRIELDPTVTYRSNLGKVDPAIKAKVRFGHFDELEVFGGTGTFTNDSWIRSDILNTVAAIGVGTDARNYFRADRVRADLTHEIVSGPWDARLWIGGDHERDWSTGIHTRHSTAPWSILGRTDTLKMRRINPAVVAGHLTSGLGGIRAKYEQAELKGTIDAQVEHAFDGPDLGQRGSGTFTQFTLDARTKFPTFGTQTFAFQGHAVLSGDGVPPQRFVYLGGAGTLGTVDLLALGGDRLAYVEGEYRIPLARPLLPYVGAPVLTARYAAGSAGVDELPDFIQNLSVGIGLKVVKAEYHLDPNYRKTPYTHKSKFSVGFSLSL